MAATPNSSLPGGTRFDPTSGSALQDYYDSSGHSQYLAARLPASPRVTKEAKCGA
jgi:hypothetical protein